jgi:hypothetical protein
MLSTTFALLKSADACPDRYRHLTHALGGIARYGKETPITLLQILDANGIDDALWALCAVPDERAAMRDRLARLFGCDCAERVLPIWEKRAPTDRRPHEAIAVARRYARGEATNQELAAARAAERAWQAEWFRAYLNGQVNTDTNPARPDPREQERNE